MLMTLRMRPSAPRRAGRRRCVCGVVPHHQGERELQPAGPRAALARRAQGRQGRRGQRRGRRPGRRRRWRRRRRRRRDVPGALHVAHRALHAAEGPAEEAQDHRPVHQEPALLRWRARLPPHRVPAWCARRRRPPPCSTMPDRYVLVCGQASPPGGGRPVSGPDAGSACGAGARVHFDQPVLRLCLWRRAGSGACTSGGGPFSCQVETACLGAAHGACRAAHGSAGRRRAARAARARRPVAAADAPVHVPGGDRPARAV